MATVRPYQPDDLEDTVQLWDQTWHQTFPHIQHPQPYSEWKTRFRNDLTVRGSVWIAELENRIVGFVMVIKEEQSLDQIFVDPTYQNRGIGSALLNKALAICPYGLTLQTLQQNTQAIAFYERHGFKAGRLSINKINGHPNVEYSWVP